MVQDKDRSIEKLKSLKDLSLKWFSTVLDLYYISPDRHLYKIDFVWIDNFDLNI